MAQALIQVHDLKKYYNGGDVKALDGVTADICKGDVMAVIGPSGGGKSTFLRSLNLLEKPTSGSIIFDGVDITGKKVDLPLHRQKMGMVFQHFNLFPNKTVLDNLTMAPVKIKKQSRAEAEEKAMALLKRVGLADRAHDWPAQLSQICITFLQVRINFFVICNLLVFQIFRSLYTGSKPFYCIHCKCRSFTLFRR